MSDLVSRLRHWARIASAEDPDRTPAEQMLYWEAADEIERLQTLLGGSRAAPHPSELPERLKEAVSDAAIRPEYRVFWSDEDQEYVATCSRYPSLSHLEIDPECALLGLVQLIEGEEKVTKAKPRQEPELVEDGEGEITWHYLPVYVEYEGERTCSLCEVYIRDGKLTGWTDAQIAPIGDSPEDLAGSLERMLDDARHWKPVRFDDLEAGMVLEALTSEPSETPPSEGAQ